MNQDDINKLRHSFTNPYKEDMPKFKINQFGHTILNSDEDNIDIESVEVKIDEFGEIKAEAKNSIFDNPKIINFLDSIVNENSQEEDCYEVKNIQPQVNIYSELLSELDEMDGTKFKQKQTNNVKKEFKYCINKGCLYSLPKDANFCSKCGIAQLSKFCVECGFNFKFEEKFCPDCGTKR